MKEGKKNESRFTLVTPPDGSSRSNGIELKFTFCCFVFCRIFSYFFSIFSFKKLIKVEEEGEEEENKFEAKMLGFSFPFSSFCRSNNDVTSTWSSSSSSSSVYLRVVSFKWRCKMPAHICEYGARYVSRSRYEMKRVSTARQRHQRNRDNTKETERWTQCYVPIAE